MTALPHNALRLLLWLAIGAVFHAAAMSMFWLINRDVDTSLLMPWAYPDHGWFLTIAYYCLWLWLWMNE